MPAIGFIIDGKESGGASGKTFERKDPITGKVATVAAAASLADVDTVAEAAAKKKAGPKPGPMRAAHC